MTRTVAHPPAAICAPLIRDARARLRRLTLHDYRIADDGQHIDVGPVRLCADGSIVLTKWTRTRLPADLHGIEGLISALDILSLLPGRTAHQPTMRLRGKAMAQEMARVEALLTARGYTFVRVSPGRILCGRVFYCPASQRIRLNVVRRRAEPVRGLQALFDILEAERRNPELAPLYARAEVLSVDPRAGLAGKAAAIANKLTPKASTPANRSASPDMQQPMTLADIARQFGEIASRRKAIEYTAGAD